jgi:nitrogen PTS system EIIA component
MVISKYLDKNLVVFLDEKNRNDAITRLVNVLTEEGTLESAEEFHSAILEREKVVSTGIGIGVAIPHAKITGCSKFFIVVGIQKGKGLEWNALDGSLVRLVFMIGGPDNKQTEYLKILSSITQAIKDEPRRKRLLKCKTAEDVLKIFDEF